MNSEHEAILALAVFLILVGGLVFMLAGFLSAGSGLQGYFNGCTAHSTCRDCCMHEAEYYAQTTIPKLCEANYT